MNTDNAGAMGRCGHEQIELAGADGRKEVPAKSVGPGDRREAIRKAIVKSLEQKLKRPRKK